MFELDTTHEDRLFRYDQIMRQGNVAIFTQTHKVSGVVRYEVVRIRIAREHTWPNGHITPEHEVYPGDNTWGRDGRTFFHLSNAEHCFCALTTHA